MARSSFRLRKWVERGIEKWEMERMEMEMERGKREGEGREEIYTLVVTISTPDVSPCIGLAREVYALSLSLARVYER